MANRFEPNDFQIARRSAWLAPRPCCRSREGGRGASLVARAAVDPPGLTTWNPRDRSALKTALVDLALESDNPTLDALVTCAVSGGALRSA